MEKLTKETSILDYNNSVIQALIKYKNWEKFNDIERVKLIYNFVRDEIRFGYNISDDIKASQVLKDGYGQCNTKSTLLMALLRAVNIPNRLHGFTIDKALQKGAIDGIWYELSPSEILHSWVEVYVNGNWFNLEGVILDKEYLNKLQSINSDKTDTFCGYGVYTDNFLNPPIEWDLNDTYIQDQGINKDFGIFDTPDDFYLKHRQELSCFKKIIYRYVVRHIMNRNVSQVREKECF